MLGERFVATCLYCCKDESCEHCPRKSMISDKEECRKELMEIAASCYEEYAEISERHEQDMIDVDRMCRKLSHIRMKNGEKVTSYRTLTKYIAEKQAEAVMEFSRIIKEEAERQREKRIAGLGIFSAEAIEYFARAKADRIIRKADEGMRCDYGSYREETGIDHPGMLRVSFGGFRENAGADGGERGDGRSDAGGAGEAPTEREGAGSGSDPDGVYQARV